MSSQALMWIATLSEKQRLTLRLIADFLRENGGRCFNYRRLRAFWDRRRMWRSLEWHTAERVVRLFAEDGLLERRGRGRRVEFCLSDRLEKMLGELGWL